MVSKEEIKRLFDAAEIRHFKKKGKFLFRQALIGETILTIVSGKLETMKTVEKESVIIKNIEIGSSAENYVIDKSVFEKRYTVMDQSYLIDNNKWTLALAKGEVHAFEHKGDPINFMAPWNEEMLCEDGDYIARPVGGDVNDIYRIEKDTFKQTYELVVG